MQTVETETTPGTTERHTITVHVEGGAVCDVEGVPPGIDVVVRDYDVEGGDADDVTEDDDGNECVETVY